MFSGFFCPKIRTHPAQATVWNLSLQPPRVNKGEHMKSKNDYHHRPQTNGRSCPRRGRISRSPSSPLAEGRAFHPVGDSSRAAMERRHPSTDPRRRVKGHTQSHQPSLAVSAVIRWIECSSLQTAFVLTAQLNRDRFQGYGRQRHQSVVL